MDITQENVLMPILEALKRAYAKHGRDQWGRHEFYGILLEEVDELWDAIKRDEPLERVVSEVIDILVVGIRYMETGDRHMGPLPLPEPDYDMAEEQRKPISERAWNKKPEPAWLTARNEVFRAAGVNQDVPFRGYNPWPYGIADAIQAGPVSPVPATDWDKVRISAVRSARPQRGGMVYPPNPHDVQGHHHNALDPVAAISPEHNPNGVFLKQPDGTWSYLGEASAIDFDAIQAPYVVALGRTLTDPRWGLRDPEKRSPVMPSPGGLGYGDPAKSHSGGMGLIQWTGEGPAADRDPTPEQMERNRQGHAVDQRDLHVD